MAFAIFLLFGLLFAFFMAILAILAYTGVISGVIWLIALPAVFAVLIVLFQWWVSPYILKWIYKIVWVDPASGFSDRRIETVYRKIEAMAAHEGVAMPKFGLVLDDNPNAFTFGWTRNRSFLVLTRGVFKYCDDDEVEAVAAHEVGHIVHNDFVVMTVITAVVLLFYVVVVGARMVMYTSRGGGRNAGQVAAVAAIVFVVSYAVYILANYISLLISRYREYWADEFSGKTTRRPNSLSSALVKIAYGLAVQGRGLDGKAKRQYETRHSSALGIFNANAAKALAVQAATANGRVEPEAIKETMAWDLWNPWAFFYEFGMTHPLTAKRILAMGKIAEDQGQMPYVTFDLKKPESYWDDFLRDVFMRHMWWLVTIPACFLLFWYALAPIQIILPLGMFIMGALGFIYLRFYRYTPGFRDTKVEDLLRIVKAGPVRGIPVRLRGVIIGRGQPGLFYSEDLKVDDGTGLLLLDYRRVLRIMDFFAGVFSTQKYVGQEVVVEGWYRRPVVPLLELRKMTAPNGTKSIYRPYVEMVLAGLVMVLGGFFLAFNVLM
jgi:Zn-dependent protease with chaperone function